MTQPKLTIELVPHSLWGEAVRNKVSKEAWDKIRKGAYRNANYLCQICGGKGDEHPVECHEVFEYDDDKRLQILKEFIAICPLCHQVKHMGRTIKINQRGPAFIHLMRVNRWNVNTANEYIYEVFKVWFKRSFDTYGRAIQWSQDFSILDHYINLSQQLPKGKIKFRSI